jgi:aspartyl-tRNA(Asn)/glutamyl-tRNA(Gln) amidotransferase subunit C
MSLRNEDVEKIAHLARLKIEDNEIEGYARQLSNILDFVEQMNEVDTDGVEPMAHPQELAARLRLDQVTETDQRKSFQSIAPSVENGFYLVPRVIE